MVCGQEEEEGTVAWEQAPALGESLAHQPHRPPARGLCARVAPSPPAPLRWAWDGLLVKAESKDKPPAVFLPAARSGVRYRAVVEEEEE